MVVDFHTHVLPRLDDGSKSTEMSLEMLHRMKASGVDLAVATPHYSRRQESIEGFLDRRSASYRRLQENLDGDCPRLLPAAEVAFYFGMDEDDALDQLCVEGTRTLLLEMPFAPWTDYEVNVLSALCFERDMAVVLAHYERFEKIQSRNGLWERIMHLPLSIQINADTLLPVMTRGRWLKAFRDGRAQLLGSDCHNLTDRPPNLEQARSVLRRKLGSAALEAMDRHPEALLHTENA